MSLTSTDKARAALADLRSDPKKTSARYDEIISLRMFLLDIQDELANDEDPKAIAIRKDIGTRAARWGKRGDCV